MSGLQLVIFDLDGTLVDAYPAIVESFNHTMTRMRLPLKDPLTIKRAVGWGDTNLLKPFVGEKNIKKALRFYRRHHQYSLGRKTRFLPRAKGLLSFLKKKGYRLALASNRPARFTRIILKHLAMNKYFDYVLCGDQLKKAKPHPDIILKILKKLSVSSREAVFVGDMTVDVISGKKAKVKTIAVLTGSSSKKEIQALKPFRMTRDLKEVKRFLRQDNGHLKGDSP